MPFKKNWIKSKYWYATVEESHTLPHCVMSLASVSDRDGAYVIFDRADAIVLRKWLDKFIARHSTKKKRRTKNGKPTNKRRSKKIL